MSIAVVASETGNTIIHWPRSDSIDEQELKQLKQPMYVCNNQLHNNNHWVYFISKQYLCIQSGREM